jgi:hypothetical protein
VWRAVSGKTVGASTILLYTPTAKPAGMPALQFSGADADEADGLSVLAAVVENRATEVGLAVLNTDTMSLRMVQLIETSRSYTNVLSLLRAFRPAHLVIVASNQAINLGVNRATRASFHQVLCFAQSGLPVLAERGVTLQGCAGGSAAAGHALAWAGGGLRARDGGARRSPSAPGALPRVVRHGGLECAGPWPGLPHTATVDGQPCAAAASSHCSDGRGLGPRRPPAAGQSCSGGSAAGATQDAAQLLPPREARLRAPLSRPGTSMPHDRDQVRGSATAALDAVASLPACRARPDAPPEWPDGVPAQGGAPQRPCRPASTSPLSASRHLASARAVAQLPALPRLCCRLAAGGHVDRAGFCARRARLQRRRRYPACSWCMIYHMSCLQAAPPQASAGGAGHRASQDQRAGLRLRARQTWLPRPPARRVHGALGGRAGVVAVALCLRLPLERAVPAVLNRVVRPAIPQRLGTRPSTRAEGARGQRQRSATHLPGRSLAIAAHRLPYA